MNGKTYLLRAVVVGVGAVGVVGCGGNPPPQAQADRQQLSASAPADGAKATGGGGQRQLAPAPDAQWTIAVHTIRGPSHVAEAKRLKDDLIQTTPLKNWYVVHGETDSKLFHGYYKTFEGKAEPDAARARADLAAVKEVKDVRGVAVFKNAGFVPIATGDPEAPPEWNLTNSGGYYSLQIAAYDAPGRKQAAVDSVREAREQGIEAYYHHGDRYSIVCVGAWPATAFEMGESVANEDPKKRIIMTNEPLPEHLAQEMEKTAGKRNDVLLVTAQGKVKDEGLRQMMLRYPHHQVNDEVYASRVRNPKTGEVSTVPDSSFLVLIPKTENSILGGSQLVRSNGQQGPRQPAVDAGEAVYGERKPAQPTAAPQGKLRSITD